jgi:hypothetical protein
MKGELHMEVSLVQQLDFDMRSNSKSILSLNRAEPTSWKTKTFFTLLLEYQQNVQELLVVCPEAVIEKVVEHTTAVKELVLATRMGPAFEEFQPLLDNERGCYRAL